MLHNCFLGVVPIRAVMYLPQTIGPIRNSECHLRPPIQHPRLRAEVCAVSTCCFGSVTIYDTANWVKRMTRYSCLGTFRTHLLQYKLRHIEKAKVNRTCLWLWPGKSFRRAAASWSGRRACQGLVINPPSRMRLPYSLTQHV